VVLQSVVSSKFLHLRTLVEKKVKKGPVVEVRRRKKDSDYWTESQEVRRIVKEIVSKGGKLVGEKDNRMSQRESPFLMLFP